MPATPLHTASAFLPEATLQRAVPMVPAMVTGTKVTRAIKATTTISSTSIMGNGGICRDIMKITIMKR